MVYGQSWYSKHRWRKFGTLIPALIAKENQAGSYMWVTGNKITVFPRIIAWGDYKFFRAKRARLFKGSSYFISCISRWKSCTKYFALLSHYYTKKIITSNKLNMGFLSPVLN